VNFLPKGRRAEREWSFRLHAMSSIIQQIEPRYTVCVCIKVDVTRLRRIRLSVNNAAEYIGATFVFIMRGGRTYQSTL